MSERLASFDGGTEGGSHPDDGRYAQLEQEMSRPDPGDSWAGETPRAPPLDQREYEEGVARQNARHAAVQQRRGQQQEEQYERIPQPRHQLPDPLEDPVAHFDQRSRRLESHIAEREYWDGVNASEAAIRNPDSPNYCSDYDAACQYLEDGRRRELKAMLPDGDQRAIRYAAQWGMTPAQLREYQLRDDQRAIINEAMRQGRPPAELYYDIAMQRGYRSQATLGRKQVDDLAEMAIANPTKFDKVWDELARSGHL